MKNNFLDNLKKQIQNNDYDKYKLNLIQTGITLYEKGKISLKDLKLLANNSLGKNQMIVIYWGLEKGLDVSIYAKPEFNTAQMSFIYYGLKEGLDVSIYAKPEFSATQMKLIYWGLKHGLDVTKYAKPEFSYDQMLYIFFDLIDELIDENPSLSEEFYSSEVKIQKEIDYDEFQNRDIVDMDSFILQLFDILKSDLDHIKRK